MRSLFVDLEMHNDRPPNASLSRRRLLAGTGTVAGIFTLASLAGCGSGSSSDNAAVSQAATSDTVASDSDGSVTVNATDWLSGGTAAMEAPFPPESDPLDIASGNVVCTISGTNRYTIGPCYFDVDDYRDDISEGQPGVPMTLAMKLVDADCDPITDADIEVWWCNWEGIYSGDDSDSTGLVSNFNSGFCTDNDTEAATARWFRGVQRTDSAGNVYFKACFPGWYPSRTTHIHFRVVVDGVERLISQFCFDDDLCNDIYLNHSEYTGIAKDTDNDRDTVFGSEHPDYTFIVDRQFDGSMLAYKAIQLV